MSLTDRFNPSLERYGNSADVTPAGGCATPLGHSQLIREIQRERLRQAERCRLQRAALRARRTLAQQLMR